MIIIIKLSFNTNTVDLNKRSIVGRFLLIHISLYKIIIIHQMKKCRAMANFLLVPFTFASINTRLHDFPTLFGTSLAQEFSNLLFAHNTYPLLHTVKNNSIHIISKSTL